MEIGNLNPDNFKTECYVCGDTKELSMRAIRKAKGIVGWLFVCPKCGDVLAEKWNKEATDG